MSKSQLKRDDTEAAKPGPPRFEDGPPLAIAGLRGHFTPATWNGISAQWQHLLPYLGKIPGQSGRATYGLCFLFPDGIDYLSGVEVSPNASLPAEFTAVKIPAQHYAVFEHQGHVSQLHATLEAIEQTWFPSSGHSPAVPSAGAPNFFERYGEAFNPQTGMGGIEVWIPIKK